MGEIKHTPGLWRYWVRKDGSIGLSIGDPNRGPHYQGDLCASENDARLIVAAPELLGALKELLAACEDDCGAVGDLTEFDGDDEPVGGALHDDGSPDPMALTFGHLRRAARAIAKAEGKL